MRLKNKVSFIKLCMYNDSHHTTNRALHFISLRFIQHFGFWNLTLYVYQEILLHQQKENDWFPWQLPFIFIMLVRAWSCCTLESWWWNSPWSLPRVGEKLQGEKASLCCPNGSSQISMLAVLLAQVQMDSGRWIKARKGGRISGELLLPITAPSCPWPPSPLPPCLVTPIGLPTCGPEISDTNK